MINIEKLSVQLPQALAHKAPGIRRFMSHYLADYTVEQSQQWDRIHLQPIQANQNTSEKHIAQQIAQQLISHLQAQQPTSQVTAY
ncbi:MAG: hypothetical protein JKY13_00300 [Gammaproteobacteria bacterium]|nr:hypothetical protein [Gammaproteobacteria bacterium]